MTWKQLRELANSNALFIEGIPDTFMRTVYAAQLSLYSLCFDQLDKLETVDGEITNTSKNRKLIAGLAALYEIFRANEIQPIMNDMVDQVTEVTQNNTDYYYYLADFSSQFVDSNEDLNTFNSSETFPTLPELDQAIKTVHDTINFRLGITIAGELIFGGFLFNLYHDKTVITNIQQSVYKGMITGDKLSDLKQIMKVDIIGETQMLPDENIQVSGSEAKAKTPTTPKSQTPQKEQVTKNGLLGRVFSPAANDVFAQVDRTASTVISDTLKLKYFIYSGTIVKNSRAFCILKCNKIFDVEEAKGWIDENPGPLGVNKDTYDPLLDCGGANCRHTLFYITDELYQVLKDKNSDLIPA